MDTSETYIKMCNCEEIQRLWTPTNGDICWHDNGGDDYLGDWEFPATTAVVHIQTGNDRNYWYNWLWLPRQDQLQEMVKGNKSMMQMVRWMADFLRVGNPALWKLPADCSMEQLWLAFVMKEKYNKVWNGDKWKKEE